MTLGQALFIASLVLVLGLVVGRRRVLSLASRGRGSLAPPLASGPVGEQALLFFQRGGCGHCRAMRPTLERLAAADPRVRVVDVEDEPEATRAYRVLATPTLVRVEGGVIAEVRVGEGAAGELARMHQALDSAQPGPPR